MKRALSFLLSLVLLFGAVPVQALANETVPAAEPAEPTVAETTVPVVTEAAETVPTEVTEATEAALPVQTEATEETLPAQTIPEETVPATEAADAGTEEFSTITVSNRWETLSIGGETVTSEDLFAGYVDSVFYGKPVTPLSTGSQSAGARLTGDEAKAYKALVPIIKQIAAGNRASSIVTLNPTAGADASVTFSESYKNFDGNAVFDALWSDLAYEMYWTWNPCQWEVRYYTSNNLLYEVVFYFAVENQFRTSSTNYYTVNTAKTSIATKAANNAKAIVSKYAGKPDYDKLWGYCTEICALNTYNDAAADNSQEYAQNDYGPWQILYVFDKNSSTNVVCGGYSKAFQYLCDIGGIQCYYITGYTSGYHAWNIVTLRGRNYLVDVTNIDDGNWGSDGSLFLAGGSGSPRSGYTFTNSYGNRLTYTYEDVMFNIWSTNVLTLSSSDYVPCSPHNYTSKVTKAATCTATGTRQYTCSGCGHTYTETIAKTAHKYSQKVTAATCTTQGYTTFTCSCGKTYKDKYTAVLGHDWKIQSRKDADCQHYASVTYSCSRCKKTKTEQITSGWSEWSTSYPTGIDSSRIQTKTQYRYRDTGTGWTVTETGTIEYVSPWPSGFNTGHSLYNQYNKAPKTASQTETQRVTVHFDQCVGYIYWHWCRGSYTSGPIDRYISDCWTGTYPAFHAYFSTQTTSIMDAATRKAYQMPNANCCRDSYWYYRLPVMCQSYTVETLQSNGTGGAWSSWSDTVYTASAYREVETRKVYRYSTNGYGQHVYDDGKVTVEPSGSNAGTKRFTCTVCGSSYTKKFYYSDSVYRVSGTDRCQTARLAANRMKIELGGAQFKAMIYANGDQFADALAGSYLAARKSAPILLYRKSGAAQNLAYIKQHLSSSGTVYILGGNAAVPTSVETELKNAGIRVQRLSGSDRFDTNIKILKTAGFTGGEVLVCTAYNFADSLSASATGKPILLVNSKTGKLTNAQKQYLSSLGSRSFTIIGGTGAVSKELETALKAYGSVSRLSGSTRYETSVAVAKRYFKNPDAAVLAYAQNFPDGLCGGPLAYVMKAPLILTKTGSTSAADAYADAYGIRSGYVLGGTGLISDNAARSIFNLAENIEIKKK